MNIETLIARRAELDSTIMQLASQWQTAQGHVNEIAHWIEKMEKAESSCDFAIAPEEPLPVE